MLEGLKQAQGFVDAAAHGQVVDGALHDHTIGIDDKKAAERHAGFLIEHLVSTGDVLLEIGEQRVGDVAQAAIFAVGLDPGQVAELTVYRHPKHLTIAAGEIAVAI